MALIYRSIFEVEDEQGTFVDRASAHVRGWLRYKLSDPELELPDQGSTSLEPYGIEIETTSGANEECSVVRVAAFEGSRKDGVEVKTTLTAIRADHQSWAWVDLERWNPDHGATAWIPVAPGIVTTILLKEVGSRGGFPLSRKHVLASGEEGAMVATLVLDPTRELPLVVVSYNRDEAHAIAAAEERGRELARRLAGLAGVYVLGEGGVTAFSREMHDAVGEGMDVHSGAVRTYLPGVGAEADFPGRHRFLAFRKLDGRRSDLAARIVTPPLLRRAVETPPPPIWRAAARSLLLGHAPDADYEELLAIAEEEIGDLRASLHELAAVRDDLTELQSLNDDLGRRLVYYKDRLREAEPTALGEEPAPDAFEPVLCSDVLAEARLRLAELEIPDAVDEGALALDEHGDESWASRAWSALQALNRYAELKRQAEFDGSFLMYCERSAGEFVIPRSWVVPTESASTRENPRFREPRTLPVSADVDRSGRTFMQEHIRIERGGTPSPRIYYHDDTRGVTGKIHIGWFGDHLDSRAKP
jgi:hypothetical protein